MCCILAKYRNYCFSFIFSAKAVFFHNVRPILLPALRTLPFSPDTHCIGSSQICCAEDKDWGKDISEHIVV